MSASSIMVSPWRVTTSGTRSAGTGRWRRRRWGRSTARGARRAGRHRRRSRRESRVRDPVVAGGRRPTTWSPGAAWGSGARRARRGPRPSRAGVVAVQRPHLHLVARGDQGQGQVARQLLDAAHRRRVGAREQGDPGHGRRPTVGAGDAAAARRSPGGRGTASEQEEAGHGVDLMGWSGSARVDGGQRRPGRSGRQRGSSPPRRATSSWRRRPRTSRRGSPARRSRSSAPSWPGGCPGRSRSGSCPPWGSTAAASTSWAISKAVMPASRSTVSPG